MHLRLKITSVLIVISAIFCAYSNATCPNSHLLHPCTCLKSTSIISCEDLDNQETLKAIIEVSKSHKIAGVELLSSAVMYIPEDAFDGSNIEFLHIVNSSILSLSDTSRAFIGLQQSLKSFRVINCPFANGWKWTHLANLTMLNDLEISESELIELDDDFLRISKLPIENLKFRDTGIMAIPENAFSSFKDLERFSMDRNKLINFERSMLPKPAKKLVAIGLSHNRLTELPEDMFVQMPALKFLYLGSNPMYILDEKTFKPVWKHINMFAFQETRLVCDCRLTWMTKMKNEKKLIYSVCKNPTNLKGRTITSLKKNELKCFLLSKDE